MLQKYDECIGRRYTSAGEVTAGARPRAGSSTQAGRARPGLYTRGASWKLELYTHETSWKLEAGKGGKTMFYVVDQWGQYINEFETRDEAEWYCEKWNSKFRFSEWTKPKAHVEEAE